MKITDFFFKNELLLITVIIIMLFGGIAYYLTTPRNEDPGFKIRTAVVTTSFIGANANQVDKYVTDKIEEAVEQMGEVEDVKSRSYDNKSVVYVDVWEYFKELQPIWDKLRRKVDNAKLKLPKNTVVNVNDEFGDVYGIVLALIGEDFDYWELKDYSDKVKDELLKLENSAKVEVMGVQKEVVYLYYDNAKLAKYRLTSENLQKILSQSNIISPSGEILVGDKYLLLQTQDNYKTVENIKNTAISLPDRKESLKFGEILNVEKTYLEPSEVITGFMGKKALIIALSMKENGNILKFGKDVKKRLKELNFVAFA